MTLIAHNYLQFILKYFYTMIELQTIQVVNLINNRRNLVGNLLPVLET